MSTYEEGHREGYKTGYAVGFSDGNGVGYSNAKERAFNAIQNASQKGVPTHQVKQLEDSIEQQLGKRFA